MRNTIIHLLNVFYPIVLAFSGIILVATLMRGVCSIADIHPLVYIILLFLIWDAIAFRQDFCNSFVYIRLAFKRRFGRKS